MVRVTFIEPDGTERTVQGAPGGSLMSLAVTEGIEGIVAECGGSMMCATCHCYVDDTWVEKIEPRADGEEEMLEFAVSELKATSRLSCQIMLSEALDGLIIQIPERQV